jgi:hypothetical protein
VGHPVYYTGALEIQPPLTEAHAMLVEALVDMQDNEETQSVLDAIRASDDPDLPYYGGQLYVSADRSKIEARDGEQSPGLRLWLVHLVRHVFIPHGYTLNGEISWDASDDPDDRATIYVKNNALETADHIVFDPGPSWAPNHFVDSSLKEALEQLMASADDAGCPPDRTVISRASLSRVQVLLAKTA